MNEVKSSNELSIEQIEEKIKNTEHRIRYSKNPMEQRQLRSEVGKLQRTLKIMKDNEKSNINIMQ